MPLTIQQVVENLDWNLLRDQKLDLTVAALTEEDDDIKDLQLGIIELLDNIQDAAVFDGVATQLEVFGER
jgi:hypothetical protein